MPLITLHTAHFILGITTVLFLVQLFYLIRMLRFKAASGIGDQPPVSVVVCGKNEEENWKKLIPELLQQSYPEFEIVAVNDRSHDDSVEVLEHFMSTNPRVRLVDVKENDRFTQGKKFALTLGIKAAKHEHLIFTDADCLPSSKEWLQEMVKGFHNNHIVLGYGDYFASSGLLNKVIRWETLHAALMSFSSAYAGKAYMGVGRNLAYTKTLFFARKGFYDHMHIPMGDDDLFVNQAAPLVEVGWVTGANAKTMSYPNTSWRLWWHQKRRHLGSSKFYRRGSKWFLGIYGMTKAFFYIGSVLLLISPLYIYGVALLFAYLLLLTIAAFRFSRLWSLGRIYLMAPVLDAILINLQGMLMLTNFFRSNPKKW